MSNTKAGRYSMLSTTVPGTTGTGLDQLVNAVFIDTGLAGANMAGDLLGGAAAADAMNQIILEAAAATGAAADGHFTAAEVVAMNAWIREHRLTEWTTHHGDDEGADETGFHLVQNDGANLKYRGASLIDAVADGIYHLGFEIQGDRFVNEDGDANATVDQVAAWLTQFYTDHSHTASGLDRISDLIMADAGLPMKTPEADIAAGADAANSLNQLIMDGLSAVGGLVDGKVTPADVIAVNTWIRGDASRLAHFIELHGDDENGSETGYHLVQNDGATTKFFGKNLANTVADGLYHIGFEIVDGRFRNEDGDANATVSDVADWLNYFLSDASSTGTGLDRIVDTIKVDAGLARNTPAADIDGGADAANALNALILEGIAATGAMADGWITSADLEVINAWLRSDAARLARFIELHGDDENGSETGYHLVQNDGANTNYFGQNLVNTVADGIYHFGFAIENGRFVNEDGDANATLADVASWLNYFVKGSNLIIGSDAGSLLDGTDEADQIIGYCNADTIEAGAGDDLVNAGHGNDLIRGGDGNDLLLGEGGDDSLDGGNGSDSYRVSGNQAGGWSSFAGFDTYADTGASGTDRIVGTGTDVDIGLRSFSAASGIELIDASAASGTTRLVGDWSEDTIDLRGVTVLGNVIVDGYHGNDSLFGNDADNTLQGGGGDDSLDGGNGVDTYVVSGNQAGGWSSFAGFDTYTDTGASGTDRIVAQGTDVDIGLRSFSAASGIEVIDASGASGTTRLVGDWSEDTIDLRGVTVLGNVIVDGYHGNDSLFGNDADNTLQGGGGDDSLDGGNGADTYVVSGNQAGGWSSFAGFDTYTDTGASGTDRIVAQGADVDIGLRSFSAASGIELIDASAASGTTRLVGDWSEDTIDLRGVTVLGNVIVDGYHGNDSLFGNDADNTLQGGGGDDTMDGGNGADTYVVSGNQAGGWDSFAGFDTYADTGASGTDRIVAQGADVDIGLRSFSAASGIEVIDASGASGTTRLVGDWSEDTIDLRGVTVLGNVIVDGYHGNDSLFGNDADNTLQGGGGDDSLDGGNGSDSYRVSGTKSKNFAGFDSYNETGVAGTDRIVAIGTNVDIGLRNFSAGSGIEQIDASGVTGTVRLLGDWSADTIDLRGITVLGRVIVDGASGDDRLIGSTANDDLRGGSNNDLLMGGAGQDSLDGGKGNDLLLGTQGASGGREFYMGGTGNDRIALAHNDGSALDIRGGSLSGKDKAIDIITLIGTRGALAFSASVLDFEVGKDRIDLSQLRDAGNNGLALDDLLISASDGNTQIGFAAGVRCMDGGAVDVQITLVGVAGVDANAFSFGAPSLAWGIPSLDTALGYL
jgi:Ca2+-binding RTX toxin-like protein